MRLKTYRWIVFLFVLALVAAACGDDTGTSTTAADTTSSPTSSTTAAPGTAATDPPSTTAAPGDQKRGGTLTIAHFVDPRTLNPAEDGGYEANFMGINIRDGLTQLDAEGNLEGSLAVSWSQPDPLTYVFELREGVVFHDGSEFTAADVKYTFDKMVDPEVSAYAGNFTPLIESTEIIDDYTVQVNLKIPYFGFPDEMARNSTTRILPEGYLDGDVPDDTVVGTGPFMVKSWTKGGQLVLERNPNYWNPDEAFVDEIVFKVVPDAQTQLVQLQAHQVDIVLVVPPSAVEELQADPDITVNGGPSGKSQELLLNTLQPPFDNLNVRKGVLSIVDRQEVIDLGAAGFGKVPTDIFPSYLQEWNPDANWDMYDPEGGVALLRGEGFSEDSPLEFELRTINTNFFIDQATVLKQQFEATGIIKVNVTPMEKGAFLAPLFREEDPLQWQAALEMYSFTTDPQSFYWEQFAADSYINSVNVNLPGGYQLPELEQVVSDALAANSLEEAKALWARELELIQEHALQLRIAYFDNIQAYGPGVMGFDSFAGNEYPLRLVWLDR